MITYLYQKFKSNFANFADMEIFCFFDGCEVYLPHMNRQSLMLGRARMRLYGSLPVGEAADFIRA